MNDSTVSYNAFHIHGDNIVECERAFYLICQSLSEDIASISSPDISVACPRFTINFSSTNLAFHFTFFPGFGRWDHDILQSLRDRGGVLRETADAIVTGVAHSQEHILFAIEFCGALPAGNQAWQRSGRAYSFGAARVPYLYISELGGFELDDERNRKAPRTPNPAVPFSYLAYSIERGTPIFPIFVTSPGADQRSRNEYQDEFADEELVDLVRSKIDARDSEEILKRLQLKVLAYITKKAAASRAGETLSSDEWDRAFHCLTPTNTVTQYLSEAVQQPWSKTAYIRALTDRFRKLMALGRSYGVGLTSSKLPMCIIGDEQRADFSHAVERLYNAELSSGFIGFLRRSGPLAICWVNGFKPRGDDARPDRGLPPLARMIVGKEHHLLTIVYGPAPKSTWPTLRDQPGELMQKNGLWEVILELSDGLLAESSTNTTDTFGYHWSDWMSDLPAPKESAFFVTAKPTRLGENDVDTALHLLLEHNMGVTTFEGMCNPPGGDWSGVSVLDHTRAKELRWLSLPRVSGPNTKRPDHVFQLLCDDRFPLILSVESKEVPRTLEHDIGSRLNLYIRNLFSSSASIERPFDTKTWQHSSSVGSLSKYRFASAGAFLHTNDTDVKEAITRSKTDLCFSLSFSNGGTQCSIQLYAITALGDEISAFLVTHAAYSSIIHLKRR